MTPEEFRRSGYRVIDWLADYMESVERHPVLSQVEPGWVRGQLPPHPPESPEPFTQVLADIERVIVPGITHWQSPSFFAYFPASSSGPSILGELLAAGLGVQGMLWATSPACTELETHVLDWLVEMCALPDGFRSTGKGGGVIEGSASEATLVALLAARERSTHYASDLHGTGGDLIAYTSTQGHSSIEKAVRVAGLGAEQLRRVEVDSEFAMIPEKLSGQIEADLAMGLTPCFVTATVGTTSTTAVDPLKAIGEICRDYGIWLHVDAAFSGTAALLEEKRYMFEGLALADSYCFNPHKWMLTNYDCTAFFVQDRAHLVRTLSVMPEYLRNRASESGEVWDYRDWQISLGRRFRALKLWMVIRHYGVEGLRRHIRHQIEMSDRFASWVSQDPDFELAAPHPVSLVCFRHRGGDRVNQGILDAVNVSGKLYLTHTRLDGALTLRLAIGGAYTEDAHVASAWEAIKEAARAQTAGSGRHKTAP